MLDSRDPSRFLEGKWEARGWQWVDPLKDVQASILGIGAGLTSRTACIAEGGGDAEDVFEELAEENKMAEEFDLDFTLATAKPPIVNKGSKDSILPTEEEADGAAADDTEKKSGGSLIALRRGRR